MKTWWADTLFKRLFVLMWVALVGSHLLAFFIVTNLHLPPGFRDGATRPPMRVPPVLPSLPPGGPMPHADSQTPNDRPADVAPHVAPDAPRREPSRGLPTSALWLDYGVRFLVMGVAAWIGAGWLTAPVRRLNAASQALGDAIQRHEPTPTLDERKGTLEVRQAAQVFNTMARQLQAQFAAQSLLMAAISHDLRTPLARLRFRLETLQARDAADDRRKDSRPQVEQAVEDVREMDTMIGSALEMIRNQHLAEAPKRVDMPALVQSLADDLAEQGHTVTVQTFDASRGAGVVLAHPQAVSRVLGNLLSNAIRYGQRAKVSVTRTADAVIVTIDDAGPGIPEDRLEAVFQPFYRVDASRDRGAGGVGLGLYIARDLTLRQRGELRLENRAAGGLRVTLSLPTDLTPS